jgi:hypothetical protein
MFLLSDVLHAYKDYAQNDTVFMLFERHTFTCKVYLIQSTLDLNHSFFKNVFERISAKVYDTGSTNQFVVETITNWISPNVAYSIQISKSGLSTESGKIPNQIIDMLSKLQRQGVKFEGENSLTEISCKANISDLFVNLVLNDSYLKANQFKIISKINNLLTIFDFADPIEKLSAIMKQKLLMDQLIRQKLKSLNGKLKGIRADYFANNIKYADELQLCMLYGFADIDEYERTMKLDFLNGNKVETEGARLEKKSHFSSGVNDISLDDLSIPNDVIKTINDCANECYFDDKEMFQIFVNEQRITYQELRVLKPEKMPEWVFESIIDFASTKYVDDFSGQLTEVKTHLTSYFSIESILRPDDTGMLRQIKQGLREDFPGNYKWQLKSIKEVLTRLDQEKDDEQKQVVAQSNKEHLKPLEMNVIDWGLLLAIVENEYPDDAIRQLDLIKLQISRFYDVINTTAIGSEDDLCSMKGFAKEMYPGDYVKQLSYLDKELQKLSQTNHNILDKEPYLETVDCDLVESVNSPSTSVFSFSNFNKQNMIFIEIRSLDSFDAFEFEYINDKFVVTINSNHALYSHLYKYSSDEEKNTINMMISSLCHLSYQGISETVKLQDKKLFSRWSEYLEQWLLKE